jgi:hypothetical protein
MWLMPVVTDKCDQSKWLEFLVDQPIKNVRTQPKHDDAKQQISGEPTLSQLFTQTSREKSGTTLFSQLFARISKM